MDLTSYQFKPKKPKIFTRDQLLAEEIFLKFSKRIPFPRLMKMISDKGHQFIYEIFKESQDGRDPVSLFLWKYKQVKMQEIKK